MMNAAASTNGKPAGSGMQRAASATVCVAKPPVPDRQATGWPTASCVTPSPSACTTPAYSEPGTNGSGGLNWYLFCTISRSGKFRLAALIAISTSPAFGAGVGSSRQASASAPIGFSQSQACIAVLQWVDPDDRGAVRSPLSYPGRGARRTLCAACGTYNRLHSHTGMRILLSNDDGYQARGLHALHDALCDFAEVDVVAPEHNNSAKSNALTLNSPLYVSEAPNGFRYVNGTPADCVHIALTGLLQYRPDLVVSGINNGANMGDDTIYSGTVGAAMEGYLFGIPAIAFSQVEKGWAHIDAAAQAAGDLVRRIGTQPLPHEAPWLLNINIPNMPFDALRPLRLCRLGRRQDRKSTRLNSSH